MTDTIRRLPITAAIVCLILAPLTGCEGDKFAPRIPTGMAVVVSEPPTLLVGGFAGRALDDMVVLASQTAVVGHGPDGWNHLGDDWLGPLVLGEVAMNADGDVAICDNFGRVFLRRSGTWTELPPLDGVRLDDVAIDHDGSIWVCGRSDFFLPLLAHWDGAWHLYQPPEQNTGLFRLAVAGPGDLIIDGSRGLVFRFRNGAWEQPGVFTEVNDLWSDGEGRVLAAWLQWVGLLGEDGFEPLDERVFPSNLACIAGNGLGDVAVGWYPGLVSVLRGGTWEDLPPILRDDGDPVTPYRMILFDDGTIVVRSGWRGAAFVYDGASWSKFGPPSPPLRAIVLYTTYSNNDPRWNVVGAEGIEIEIDTDRLTYRNPASMGERLDVVDRVRLRHNEFFYVTAGGQWVIDVGQERMRSTAPAPHPYRAAAAGDDGEVVVVGDAGQVEWGYGGVQHSDGPGVTADLLDICSCPADSAFWVVGDAGTIARRSAGRTWDLHDGVTTADLAAVWARDDQDVFVAGSGGTVLAWDGTSWRDLHCPLDQDLLGIAGSSGRYLWVCGRNGALAIHDGDRWRELDSGHDGDLIDMALRNFRQAVVLTDDGTLLGCTVLDP